jgi:hypothetical protein
MSTELSAKQFTFSISLNSNNLYETLTSQMRKMEPWEDQVICQLQHTTVQLFSTSCSPLLNCNILGRNSLIQPCMSCA